MAKIVDFKGKQEEKQDVEKANDARDARIEELFDIIDEMDLRLEAESDEQMECEKDALLKEMTTLMVERSQTQYEGLTKKEELTLRAQMNAFYMGMANYHE